MTKAGPGERHECAVCGREIGCNGRVFARHRFTGDAPVSAGLSAGDRCPASGTEPPPPVLPDFFTKPHLRGLNGQWTLVGRMSGGGAFTMTVTAQGMLISGGGGAVYTAPAGTLQPSTPFVITSTTPT